MEYTKLGNTDIEVSKLCVGCMSFGKAGTMHDWMRSRRMRWWHMHWILESIFLIQQMDIRQEQVKNTLEKH